MLSIIIPSRNLSNWPYTEKTVTDLFNKAYREIEVIVIMDGYVLDVPLKERKNLTVVYHNKSKGMRYSINEGVAISKGEYVAKCDDHCMFAPGFDAALIDNCESNCLAVPRRYSLNGEEWKKGYGPIDYLYLTYPYAKDDQFGWGMHGKKWHGERGYTGAYYHREQERRHITIDPIISFQGSFWFMPKKLFYDIGGMQIAGFGDYQEAQEMAFKVWLSGGQCIVNKNTWYAHLHKGPKLGRGYRALYHQKLNSEIFSTDFWLSDKWSGQTRKFQWLIEHEIWSPLENWPENWNDPVMRENYNYTHWLHRKG